MIHRLGANPKTVKNPTKSKQIAGSTNLNVIYACMHVPILNKTHTAAEVWQALSDYSLRLLLIHSHGLGPTLLRIRSCLHLSMPRCTRQVQCGLMLKQTRCGASRVSIHVQPFALRCHSHYANFRIFASTHAYQTNQTAPVQITERILAVAHAQPQRVHVCRLFSARYNESLTGRRLGK